MPANFCSTFSGLGKRWRAKSFSLTERVCLGRGPVLLTADKPRLLLLSFLHRDDDVEKHAFGVLRMHWPAGSRKDKMLSGLADARLCRHKRDDGIAAMTEAVLAVLQHLYTVRGRSRKDAAGGMVPAGPLH